MDLLLLLLVKAVHLIYAVFYAGLHVQCVILVLPGISLFFSVKLYYGGGECLVKGSGFSCTFLFCGKGVSNIIHGFLQVMISS